MGTTNNESMQEKSEESYDEVEVNESEECCEEVCESDCESESETASETETPNTETTQVEEVEEVLNGKEAVQAHLEELNVLIEEHGFDKGLRILNDKVNSQEQIIRINYKLKAFQNEGTYAVYQAVTKVIGFFDMATVRGASGDNAPEMITVTKPDGSSIDIPYGRINLPTFDENSYIELDYNWDGKLTITANIRKKYEKQVRAIFTEAQYFLDNESIYKGQAISLTFEDEDEPNEPEYVNLSNIDESKILISKEVADSLIPIRSRIENTDVCVANGLDLKFGALMEGPYGTGKTLIAFMIAKIAMRNGWTFIYLKDCNYIARTLKIAENYTRGEGSKGVIVFAEDIDQAVRGERDGKIQDIVNTLDGGDTKGFPIMSIFTTNHIELIESTFMRGKRIGTLISLGGLDETTALNFIKQLVVDGEGNSLLEDDDYSEAATALVGIVPAFASEVIDKAKAYMIHRGSNKISNSDIVLAAESYKRQMEFAQCVEKENPPTNLIDAMKILGDHMFTGTGKSPKINKMMSHLSDVYTHMRDSE